MANIQEDITSQAWDLFLKFLGTGAEFVCQISHEGNVLIKSGVDFSGKFLLALINKQKESKEPTDATAQMLRREQKGETIHMMQVADENAPDLKKLFAENKILFSMLDNPNDDTKVLLYMSGDAQKVAEIISIWQAEKGVVSEISPDFFLNYYAKEGVGTISGLDKADREMFRKFAKDNNLVFATSPADEEGKYIIIYNPKDKAIVRKTMDSTVWAFSGDLGADLKDRVFDLVKNRDRLISALVEPKKKFYIANAKNPEQYIQVTANEFIYFKNSKEITRVDRSNQDFIEKAVQYIEGMDEPLFFKKEEFEVTDIYGLRDKEVVAKLAEQKAKKLPDREKLQKDQEEHNEMLERIQSKMALDDENTAGFWIYADDIDFEEGGGYEIREDIDEQMKTDIMDARKRAAKYRFHEVMAMDNRSVDYLIAEAEKLRAQPIQEHQQLERQK